MLVDFHVPLMLTLHMSLQVLPLEKRSKWNQYKMLVWTSYERSVLVVCRLEDFPKLTGKHLCRSILFNKIAALQSTTLFKKKLRHTCFSVNFTKVLRTSNLNNSFKPLLLTGCEVYSNNKVNQITSMSFLFSPFSIWKF